MKSRRLATVRITASLILLLLVLGSSVIYMIREKRMVSDNIKTIPSFSLKKTDGTIFTDNDLTELIPIVFVFFNSECDYCINEAKSLNEKIMSFNDIYLIFVSSENNDAIISFEKRFFPKKRERLIILRDEYDFLFKKFKLNGVPSTIVYNSEHSLVKVHNGQLVAKGLLKILNN